VRRYFVYIMTNHARTLYTDVTNDLDRRVREHKVQSAHRFTKKYHMTQLVGFEDFYDIDQALLAEKRIKGWTRAKKLALIERTNPLWVDLAEQFEGNIVGDGG
jgi:putative endonuclease